jgi:hypothetical protein
MTFIQRFLVRSHVWLVSSISSIGAVVLGRYWPTTEKGGLRLGPLSSTFSLAISSHDLRLLSRAPHQRDPGLADHCGKVGCCITTTEEAARDALRQIVDLYLVGF